MDLGDSLLDRATGVRRDQAALDDLWRRPDALRLAVRDGSVLATDDAAAPQVAQLDQDPALVGSRTLLGLDPQGRPWWLVDPGEPGQGRRWVPLRELGPTLDPLQIEVVMTGVALQTWHARNGFCPACGQPTVPEAAGWVRRCTADGSEHYPRTDPAIIVLVLDEEDRALLGRQATWPKPWRSTLAGFVEAGEPAESAVRREVAEEVGLILNRVRYVSSQPWPFPGSLMLGFMAWANDTDIQVDGEEIVEAEWYTREQIQQLAANGTIALPPSISIARRLVERWYGQPLQNSWLRG